MPPAAKRARKEKLVRKPSMEDSENERETSPVDSVAEDGDDVSSDNNSESEGEASGHSSTGTEEEIYRAKHTKSKKTQKRKHRATSPTPFGRTLETLLATSVPSSAQPGAPLALKPGISRQKNDEKLEIKAKRTLETERKEREERGRVQDVIGGWDNEVERSLRKVAQRGVVHLFNAIQQAQTASATTLEDNKKLRGSGKPTLPAPAPHEIGTSKSGKSKNKVKGPSKDASGGLDKNSFLDAIRSGGVVRQS